MTISHKDTLLLLAISDGEEVTYSKFSKSGKLLIDKMSEYGIVEKLPLRKNSFAIILHSIDAMESYLTQHCAIDDLQAYCRALELEDPTRAELTKLGVGSKLRSTAPKTGFHINSPDGVTVYIDDNPVKLELPDRCALFVHRDAELRIDENVLIVGVENFENMTYVHLHEQIGGHDTKRVFIERSPTLQQWIEKVPNKYLHFGDIDLAGINIFLAEYLPRVGDRGFFFIPTTIEDDIKSGDAELFKKQYSRYKNIDTDISELKKLIALIKSEGKVIEQEYYIQQRE